MSSALKVELVPPGRVRAEAAPSSSSVRFRIEPRDVPAAKVARRLYLTLSEFERVLPRLIDRGFPGPDPTTGHYDLKAVDAWMDARSGLARTPEAGDAAIGFQERLDALREQGRRR